MNGSKKMVCQASVCAMVFFCLISSLFAEERTNEETPSMDFLEFLGDWETEQGEWVDFVELEHVESEKLIETTIDSKINNEN